MQNILLIKLNLLIESAFDVRFESNAFFRYENLMTNNILGS